MCGRYVATTPAAVLADYFDIDEVRAAPPPPSWNVAPTDPVPAVVVRQGKRQLGWLQWGLVPAWASDTRGAAKTINARAETVADKPTFRDAFAQRRCLLPADGFFEWERLADGTRQAWFICRADRAPLAMAGLWATWRHQDGSDGPPVRSCTVITTTANELMRPVHDRMPVLLPADRWARWLDPGEQVRVLTDLLVPADPGLLTRYPVGAAVNNVGNNGPELLEYDRGTGSVGAP